MPTPTPGGQTNVPENSGPRLTATSDLIADLRRRLPSGTMIEHVVAVVAVVSYDRDGRPSSRVLRAYPDGAVNGYAERGMLGDALRASEREADRAS